MLCQLFVRNNYLIVCRLMLLQMYSVTTCQKMESFKNQVWNSKRTEMQKWTSWLYPEDLALGKSNGLYSAILLKSEVSMVLMAQNTVERISKTLMTQLYGLEVFLPTEISKRVTVKTLIPKG